MKELFEIYRNNTLYFLENLSDVEFHTNKFLPSLNDLVEAIVKTTGCDESVAWYATDTLDYDEFLNTIAELA